MKANDFVVSDLHFGHHAARHHNERPFDSLEEMDRGIVDAWNRVVPARGAVVYLLGDISFHGEEATRSILAQLHGTIRIVRGNHDRQSRKVERVLEERADWVRDYYESRTEDGTKVCMFHFPLRSWNGMHHGSWHLHGHSHGNLRGAAGKMMDVGIDCHPQFQPWTFDEVAARCSVLPFVAVDHHE